MDLTILKKPDDPNFSLTEDDKQSISKHVTEKIIQWALKSDIRLNAKPYEKAICLLTPHFIIVTDDKAKLLIKISISSLTSIRLSTDHSVFFQTKTDKLILTKGKLLSFARQTFLNYQISHSIDYFQKSPTIDSQFPSIFSKRKQNIFSPSQLFQLDYEKNCFKDPDNTSLYSQNFVNLVHFQLITNNPILRLDKLPLTMYEHQEYVSKLQPFFESLSKLKNISGIYLHQPYPTLLIEILPLIHSLSVFHCPNCKLSDGFEELYN